MTVENENFFDFFGITEEQVRTLYSKSGKISYIPEIHIPVPKQVIPDTGLKSMGISVTSKKISNQQWGDIIFWTIVIAAVIFFIWFIWYLNRPEPELKTLRIPEPEIERIKMPR